MLDKKVLVLGGRFLAPYICKKIRSTGHEVIALDSKSVESFANTEELTRQKIFIIDALDPARGNCLDGKKINWLNCARRQILSKRQIEGYVYLSSSHVYEETFNPITESSTLSTSNVYSKLKIETEEFISERFQDAIVLRLTNVWSTSSAVDTLMGSCLDHAKTRSELVISDRDQTRLVDLIHVDDLCRVISMCTKKPFRSGTYNVSTGEGILIANLKQWFNGKETLKLATGKIGRILDNAKLKSVYKQPIRGLKEILEDENFRIYGKSS